MLDFGSKKLKLLVAKGEIEDNHARDYLRNSLGLVDKKVESTRHSILSGPPGVGKTYGAHR